MPQFQYYVNHTFTIDGTTYTAGEVVTLEELDARQIRERVLDPFELVGVPGGPQVPIPWGERDQHWAMVPGVQNSFQFFTLQADVAIAAFLPLSAGFEVDQIAIRVQAVGDVGQLISIAAYADDDGWPGEKVADFGTQDSSVGGIMTYAGGPARATAGTSGIWIASLLTPPEGVGAGGVEPTLYRITSLPVNLPFASLEAILFMNNEGFPQLVLGQTNTGDLPATWDHASQTAANRATATAPSFAAHMVAV